MAVGQPHGTEDLTLPEGAILRTLQCHADHRGDFTELFRDNWQQTPVPLQWNLLRSNANSLRGVTAHAKHWDYLCLVAGHLVVGLHDLRARAPHTAVLHLKADRPQVLGIPPGVAHGFLSQTATILLLGASGYYDPGDHRRCRWDCPELGLDWPCTAPTLSNEDARAGGFATLKAELRAAMTAT